ncbi:cytidylyltransferase domain-containing protein [Paenibacillus sp. HJGM_3]|uniref:cytidylyltransferase domain-containing protein n=1 Tax=Paenibacillus sp. HJGM_3 TaxID=3379816 RepID=UPI00385EE1CE
MRNVAIIQARMGSTRLPGKVLKMLGETTVLELVVNRVKASQKIQEVIVATSILERDDPIESLCKSINVRCYRGSETDVMERYYYAAKEARADNIVRVTCDCPLVDPDTIDELIELASTGQYDYILKDELPVGLTSELFSMDILTKLTEEETSLKHREHIVTAFLDHMEQYRTCIYYPEAALRHPEIRLTLDTSDDYKLLEHVVQHFRNDMPLVNISKVIDYLLANKEILTN